MLLRRSEPVAATAQGSTIIPEFSGARQNYPQRPGGWVKPDALPRRTSPSVRSGSSTNNNNPPASAHRVEEKIVGVQRETASADPDLSTLREGYHRVRGPSATSTALTAPRQPADDWCAQKQAGMLEEMTGMAEIEESTRQALHDAIDSFLTHATSASAAGRPSWIEANSNCICHQFEGDEFNCLPCHNRHYSFF